MLRSFPDPGGRCVWSPLILKLRCFGPNVFIGPVPTFVFWFVYYSTTCFNSTLKIKASHYSRTNCCSAAGLMGCYLVRGPRISPVPRINGLIKWHGPRDPFLTLISETEGDSRLKTWSQNKINKEIQILIQRLVRFCAKRVKHEKSERKCSAMSKIIIIIQLK